MGFMGRGGTPSVRGGNGTYHRGIIYRRYYYVNIDNTYILLQMIAAILIFLMAFLGFVITYKTSIVDPLENTKKIILNSHTIVTLILLGFTIVSNYFSKNKKILIKRLICILLVAVLMLLAFLIIKLSMDFTYDSNKFEQIYEETNGGAEQKNKLAISLTEIDIKSEKEYYVDQCLEAYKVFTIKMYGTITLNIILIALLIYQIVKVSKIQGEIDKSDKDDNILFDEEENVKI